MLLTAENITLQRQERILLRRANFELQAGEIVHLRGENGAGKSTLLQALAGLNPPAAGRIHAAAERLYLGHGAGIQSALTVWENLYFYARLHHQLNPENLEQGLQKAIAALALTKLAQRPCRYLSAGQQRRTQLARLWLSAEKIWLLDEPLNALDVQNVATIKNQIIQHAQNGGAVVISSHQELNLPYPTRDYRL